MPSQNAKKLAALAVDECLEAMNIMPTDGRFHAVDVVAEAIDERLSDFIGHTRKAHAALQLCIDRFDYNADVDEALTNLRRALAGWKVTNGE